MNPIETRVERALRVQRAELEDRLTTVLTRIDRALAFANGYPSGSDGRYEANRAIRDLDAEEVGLRRELARLAPDTAPGERP